MKLSERQAMILLDVARRTYLEKMAAEHAPADIFGYTPETLSKLLTAILEQQDDEPRETAATKR